MGKPVPGQQAFEGLTVEQVSRAEALSAWWIEHAQAEIDMVVPKAIEYGSVDLKVMGEALVHLLPKAVLADMDRTEKEKVGQEMACAFYALGKVARVFGAFEQGRLPSVDTWLDLGIYCRMAQRIRETGVWG
jgi:hypothetical protein